MTGINLNTSAENNTYPSIGAFESAAKEGGNIQIILEGTNFCVRAQGAWHTENNIKHSVDWVTPEQAHATYFFLQALNTSYGRNVSAITSRELNLETTPDKPLQARSVLNALSMAKTSYGALNGIDFVTQIEHSARCGGSAYRQCLKQLKINPSELDEAIKIHIDKSMLEHFKQSIAEGCSPVPAHTAEKWLQDEILKAVKINLNNN